MKARCMRCRRPLPWSLNVLLPWPFCPESDLDACLTEASALVEEPVLWLDVSTYPPADASACRTCMGKGRVSAGQDYETHARRTEDCPVCLGTGEQPPVDGARVPAPTESQKRYAQWLARLDAGLGP